MIEHTTNPITPTPDDVGAVIRQWNMAELVKQASLVEAQAGQHAAAAMYFHWLKAPNKPNREFAYFNMAILQSNMGKTEDAIRTYLQCIQEVPQFPQAYINAGLCFERLGQAERAIELWAALMAQVSAGHAIAVDMQTAALNHIGRLRENRREYDEAELALRQSLTLDPSQTGVIQHWVHIRQKGCQWPVHQPFGALSEAKLWQATSPLAMLALTEQPEQLLATSQAFVARTYTTPPEHLCKGRVYQHTKVRVGYVSADIREHAVGFLMGSVLGAHDRSRYELYAYDFSRDDGTEIRQSLLASFDHVRAIHTLSDRQVAEQVLADEIDILIDMHGLSAGARPGIFSLRPAPHQGTYLGFIGPTGMPWLDFVITDEKAMPPALAKHFSEKPLYVKGSFIPWTTDERTADAASRQRFDLPDDAFVMGAFGNVYKITPEMLASWFSLMARIPSAHLMLLDDNPMTTRALKQHAQEMGADLARIRFVPRTTHAEFAANLKLLDVYLDTYPYNCGSTTIDVVKAGVPMVSRYGPTMVSRMGLSILSDLGAADNATPDQASYEERVVKLYLSAKHGAPFRYARTRTHIDIDHALDQLGVWRHPAEPKGEGKSPSGALASRVEIRQWPDTAGVSAPSSAGYWPMLGGDNPAPEWQVYGYLRQQLLTQTWDDQVMYGYVPASFAQHTGLPLEDLQAHVQTYGEGCDVVAFSPHWDQFVFQKSAFHQQEQRLPGSLELLQRFVDSVDLDLDLAAHVSHSENTVQGFYFVANARFWGHWLELAERLCDWLALPPSADRATHVGPEMREALLSQLSNVLLATGRYQSSAYDVFALPPSQPDATTLLTQGIEANALKIAHVQSGQYRYLQRFEALRATVRTH